MVDHEPTKGPEGRDRLTDLWRWTTVASAGVLTTIALFGFFAGGFHVTADEEGGSTTAWTYAWYQLPVAVLSFGIALLASFGRLREATIPGAGLLAYLVYFFLSLPILLWLFTLVTLVVLAVGVFMAAPTRPGMALASDHDSGP